jgi:hypothetical protein
MIRPEGEITYSKEIVRGAAKIEKPVFNFEKHQEFLIEKTEPKDKSKLINAIENAKQYVLRSDINQFILYDNMISDIPFQSLRDDKYKIDFKLRGQRKLLLTEIMALSESCVNKNINYNILYIGAGPGTHIIFLADCLFKHCTFHVFDDKFDGRLYKVKNIKIHKRYFGTVEDIKCYSKMPNLILLSDIRSRNISNQIYMNDYNDIILSDQKLQESWVLSIRPIVAYIKFRIIYSDSNIDYKYLDGNVELQPYAPNSSTETRLKILNPGDGVEYKYKIYNNKIMENKFYYYNAILRKSIDFKPMGCESLDDTFCKNILILYKQNINPKISVNKLFIYIIGNRFIYG